MQQTRKGVLSLVKESVSLSSDGEKERRGYDVVVSDMVDVVMERSIGVSVDD